MIVASRDQSTNGHLDNNMVDHVKRMVTKHRVTRVVIREMREVTIIIEDRVQNIEAVRKMMEQEATTTEGAQVLELVPAVVVAVVVVATTVTVRV